MVMASFSGRVTSAATGRSLNNVRIMIDSSPHEVVDIAALSWGDGDFELDLPDPGNYGVKFVADGYRSKIVNVSVGETDEKIEVSLETTTDGGT